MNLKFLAPIIAIGAAVAVLSILLPDGSIETFVSSDVQQPVALNFDDTQIEIMETDGIKHLIPLDKIKGGGPPKDGIPSIDNPVFANADNSQFMSNSDTVIGLELNGEAKAYPLFILVWHEIVNDEVGGVPVSVTYCPLCYTNQVFERIINGQTVEFGTSGKLYNSNLLMYDRLTESYWSQALGMAVKGKLTGYKLNLVPFDVITWGDWQTLHPDTLILTTDTGHIRSYATDPYGNYYTEPRIMFPVEHRDDRMHPKEIVLGFNQNGIYKAYKQNDVESDVVINDFVDDTPVMLVSLFSQNSRAFERTVDGLVLDFGYVENKIIDKQTNSEWNYDGLSISGQHKGKQLERLPMEPGFWFEWVAFHPETLVYDDDA
ncbi:DUF3179 domain-containing protein [Nitrosopumilus sp.]|uniref:DUF3179 domain-containing protein n=1 Tax=Nitrosopumilus sp. TaxID=2024843 RepID=UPI002931C794|nr:DUF3179 domain-containing protein [Nitrosopumilus sp.]